MPLLRMPTVYVVLVALMTFYQRTDFPTAVDLWPNILTSYAWGRGVGRSVDVSSCWGWSEVLTRAIG